MIKVAIPHKIYSENKVKIKNIIKKYGMAWDSGKNGWINAATGDGVYIDKAVMDMILSDTFTGDMPMTMFVDSGNMEFIAELEAKVQSIGGEISTGLPEETAPGPRARAPPAKQSRAALKENVFTRLGTRDGEGCNTPGLEEKALADLKDITQRWERRKKQILHEYARLDLDRTTVDEFIRREEIAFRKHNACWVTGEFPPSGEKGGEE